MTSQHWQNMDRLFHSALERPPEERAGFLAEACGTDEAVRREVEALIAAHEQSGEFLDAPAFGVAGSKLTPDRAGLLVNRILGHYKILGTLGAGGMGEVYLAQDTRLGRKIALKLLPPEFTIDADRVQRFEQEARAASALSHPNVCVIHEIGDTQDGRRFITMEYIEGTTLRQRLAQKRLQLMEALDVAAQIAAALAAAHAAGIVHRDIKPENVMLRDDGLVKVLDFGLAKLTQQTIETDTETLLRSMVKTGSGTIMGTVAYMSPEQARGLAVDARTDIWSLGVLLYEMVAGRAPFVGATPSDMLVSILEREPEPLGHLRRAVPVELERVVSRALAKNRDERYARVADLAEDIRKLRATLGAEPPLHFALPTSARDLLFSRKRRAVALAALLLVITTAFAYLYLSRDKNVIAKKSIAVLPFANAGGDPSMEYLSDGITESLINSLSQLPGLAVKARSTVFRYKGKETDPQKVGSGLNVQAVLNGRVVQRGDDLTLSLELVDVNTGDQMWGEQYSRKLTDLVTLQGEIARDVSHKLRVKLSDADEQRLAKNYTANPEAYQLYLRGRFYWDRATVPDFRKAIDYFQQAIAADPNYALAYAGLADAYSTLSSYNGAPPREVIPKARQAALKALSLDEGLVEAHAALGLALRNDYDFVGAEREYKRGLELNPNDATTHLHYSMLLSHFARHEEGLAEVRRALEIEPLSLYINRTYGDLLLYARKYDESIAQLKETLDLDSGFNSTYNSLGYAYWVKGRYAESVEEFAKRREAGGSQQLAALVRESFVKGGWEGFLRMKIEEFRTSNPSSYAVAMCHAALGEKDEAFAELNKAYEKREYGLVLLKVDPRLDPLRSDPRFADLMRKVGLPQ